MLKTMRKNIKSLGITLWLVIFAFVFFIFVDWGAGRLGPNPNPETVAWVKGKKILTKDFQRRLIDARERIRAKYKEKAASLINNPQFPQSILQQMIQEKAIEIKASELGLKVFDDEVREKILSYPVFKDKNGNFIGVEEYARILSYYRLTVDEFEESVRKEILLNKFKNYITSGITITNEEALSEYKKEKEKIKATLYIIDKDKMIIDKEPDEKVLLDYFKTNKDKFRIPEKRKGLYAIFSIKDELNKIKVSDKEIKDYYEKNQNEFKEQEKRFIKRIFVKKSTKDAKKKIETAMERLKKGDDFSKVAKEFSEDKYAKDGGDWGAMDWLYSFSKKEKKQIASMKEDSVSPIIETENGYSIIYLSTITPERILSLNEVKNRISQILKYKKARESAFSKASKFAKTAKKKGIKKAGEKEKVIIKETKELKRGEPFPPDDPIGIISNTLFSLTKKSKLSDPISSYSGFLIIELEKIIPEREATYNEVKDLVKKEYISKEKQKKAFEYAKSLITSIKKGESLPEAVDVKENIEITHSEFVEGAGFIRGIFDKIKKVKDGSLSEPIGFGNGVLIFKVNSKELVTKDDFLKIKEEKLKQYLNNKKELFFAKYINTLIENYGVKINNYVFSSFIETQKE